MGRAMVASERYAFAVSFDEEDAPDAAPAKGGDFPHIPFDMHRYRTLFPDKWSAFLRSHFRSAYQVGLFFDVDSKTSRDWWHGKTGPAAPFALRAVATIPGALSELMGEAA